MSTSLLLLMIKLAMVGGGGTFDDSVLSSKVLKPLGYARHAVGRSSVILQASPSVFCITLNVNFILLQLQANGTLAATLQQ